MFRPLAVFIGWRYTRSRRQDQFLSFISLVSLFGMVLGVAALIVVMSVMNGFEAELRDRILALVPHGFVDAKDGRLEQWQARADEISRVPGVVAVAPYIGGSAMIARGGSVRGVQLSAIDPVREQQVSDIGRLVIAGDYFALAHDQFGIVIGDILARHLGALVGDQVDLILPRVTVTPMGIFPRQKRFTVRAIFRSGSQLDSTAVFIGLGDGQRLYQLGDAVSGLRVAVDDIFSAQRVLARAVASPPEALTGEKLLRNDELQMRDWSQTQGSLFQAVKMEKLMVGLLLFVIIAIAAFNIVSILTMMVNDKRGDIAVLRTMGARPFTVTAIFIVQGATIGLVGVGAGALLGVPLAFNAGAIVAAIERLFGASLFDPGVYFITTIPSIVVVADVVLVCIGAWLLSLLAAIYPAWRAAQVQPADALRYE
jgi:lipoprotein-releasing system permease protein